jgi:ubiquinone/menaquinone biosynthesis C-methylase UbiE
MRRPPSDAAATSGTLEKNYGGIAPYYDATRHLSPSGRFTSECALRELRRAIARWAPRRDRLVDVACGTGHFTLGVADLVRAVVAIDLTPGMLDQARRKASAEGRVNVSFVLGSADGLPVRSGTADVVMTTRFLHLFPRERHHHLLQALVTMVRPGGILVVEHDGPFLEALGALWTRLRGGVKARFSSYHAAEQPLGTHRHRVIGVAGPGLARLAGRFPRVARALSTLFVRWPLNRFAAFVIVVYEKKA